jgi:hypothetical protein
LYFEKTQILPQDLKQAINITMQFVVKKNPGGIKFFKNKVTFAPTSLKYAKCVIN